MERLAARAEPGTLAVAIEPIGEPEAPVRGVNIQEPMPMQSVFKLPLAIFVLHKAQQGELALNETVTLTRDQLSIAHSPIADNFEARQTYTIEELVRAAVAESDNTAADMLMERVGGPAALTAFFVAHRVPGFRVDRYESELQPQAVGLPAFTGQWIGLDAFREAQAEVPIEAQKAALNMYFADMRDRMTPEAAVMILSKLAEGKLLSPAATAKMMEILASTTTGANRLKAGAPAGATVYHKTGTGPDVAGVNSATNDIGIIELEDGRRIAVAAFLAGAELPAEERDRIIAEVGRIASSSLDAAD